MQMLYWCRSRMLMLPWMLLLAAMHFGFRKIGSVGHGTIEEPKVLRDLAGFLDKEHPVLVTFNGRRFDLPVESRPKVRGHVEHVDVAEVADVLETVWGGDETLIVISSDLSHFLPDAAARQRQRGRVGDGVHHPALDPHPCDGSRCRRVIYRHVPSPKSSRSTAGDQEAPVY